MWSGIQSALESVLCESKDTGFQFSWLTIQSRNSIRSCSGDIFSECGATECSTKSRQGCKMLPHQPAGSLMYLFSDKRKFCNTDTQTSAKIFLILTLAIQCHLMEHLIFLISTKDLFEIRELFLTDFCHKMSKCDADCDADDTIQPRI